MDIDSTLGLLAPLDFLRKEEASVKRIAEGIAPAEVQVIDAEHALGIVAAHAAAVESNSNQDPKPKDRLMATLFVFANIKGLVPVDTCAAAMFHALAEQGRE